MSFVGRCTECGKDLRVPPRPQGMMLFALSHGLKGGGLFELPHRFAGGRMLGWLRHTSGSLAPCILAPCILANVIWNAVAVLLGG